MHYDIMQRPKSQIFPKSVCYFHDNYIFPVNIVINLNDQEETKEQPHNQEEEEKKE